MSGVHLQPRLRERGDVRRDPACMAAIPDPRARLAHERAAVRDQAEPQVPVGRQRRRPGEAAGADEGIAAHQRARGRDRIRLEQERRELVRCEPAGPELRQQLAGRAPVVADRRRAAEADDRVGVLGDRVALRGELARLPGVVGVQQRDPVALAELRERGLARRRGAVAALVADDGVRVGRALLLERRPHGLVQERRRRQNGDDQPNPHSGSVSG